MVRTVHVYGLTLAIRNLAYFPPRRATLTTVSELTIVYIMEMTLAQIIQEKGNRICQVDPEVSIADAAKLMKKERVGALLVMLEQADVARSIAAPLSAMTVITIRLLAIRYNWSLPGSANKGDV